MLNAGLVVSLVAGCATLATPDKSARLDGTLWWLTPDQAAWSSEQWKTELDPVQGLGMYTMILNGGFVGQELAPGQSDPLFTLFEEGDRRGLHFFLDTLSAPEWWTLKDPQPEIQRARQRIELLQARYGSYKSFRGFYIPYELYVMWDEQDALIRKLYTEVAACCKRVAPDKPVLISPFFILDEKGYLGDFHWAAPTEYEAFWTDILRQAPIDIVALQDSGEHLSFYSMEQRRPFFRAMKVACDATGKEMWANIETGELVVSSFDDYVSRFGMKTHVNDAKLAKFWHGVPADKLAEKLRLAGEFTPTAITWGYREFVRPSLGPDAQNLYEDYRVYLSSRHVSQITSSP